MDKNDESVGTGLVGAPACGDVMKLQVKLVLYVNTVVQYYELYAVKMIELPPNHLELGTVITCLLNNFNSEWLDWLVANHEIKKKG